MLWRAIWLIGLTWIGAALLPARAVAQIIQPSNMASSNGVYFWADGSYRNVNLPAYSLGMHGFDFGGSNLDLGPLQSFKPRVDGYGVSGGFGYYLPQGSWPVVFGSNARIGITGSFVDADAKQSGVVNVSVWPTGVFLDGTSAMLCTCTVTSSLSTRYAGWRVGLNASSDFAFRQVVVTPSLDVIAGRTRTRQTLSQLGDDELYSADTKLAWTDVGVKFGLAATTPLAPNLELGVGGTLSAVHRRVDFSGQDLLDIFGPVADYATSVDASANTWAFIPGGQVQLTYRPNAQTMFRLYGGADWDSRVPGIVSPGFTILSLFSGVPGTPAGIGFSGQASYFAGGGFTYAFNR